MSEDESVDESEDESDESDDESDEREDEREDESDDKVVLSRFSLSGHTHPGPITNVRVASRRNLHPFRHIASSDRDLLLCSAEEAPDPCEGRW